MLEKNGSKVNIPVAVLFTAIAVLAGYTAKLNNDSTNAQLKTVIVIERIQVQQLKGIERICDNQDQIKDAIDRLRSEVRGRGDAWTSSPKQVR